MAFEYRSKHPESSWRNAFDWMAAIGSFIVPLVLGVGFANFVLGLPVEATRPVTEQAETALFMLTPQPYFWQLFSWFGLLGGIVLVVLFLFHGAIFLTLKTKGELHDRARAFASKVGLVAILGGAVFLVAQNLIHPTGTLGWIVAVLAAIAVIAAWFFVTGRSEGLAFISSTATVLFVAVGIFLAMFPNLGFANAPNTLQLNLATAASTEGTLTLMTIAAVVFVPIVLAYSAWTYWVFRKRLGVENIPDEAALAG